MRNRISQLRFGHKSVLLVGALALVLCGTIGTTLAWMFDVTDPITNTFTVGKIEITLTETDADGDNDNDKNTYSFRPDAEIDKDAKVTVLKDSEACWLFVKVTESDNLNVFLEYEMADGWAVLTGEEGIYYREISDTDADQEFIVLKDSKVKVKEGVVQAMLDELGSEEKPFPTLAFKAYAVQKDDEIQTAKDAWDKIK